MIDPREFLEAASAKSAHDNPVKTNVLGFIDDNFNPLTYPQVKPRVEIPGQGLSHKGFTCINNYRPHPGDRVILMPIGTDYVIAGSIGTQETPLLYPGTTVWEAQYIVESTSHNTNFYPKWENVRIDLVGSVQKRAQTTRFHPGVPGWYSIGASVMFAPSTSGQRCVWLNQNSTANELNRVQVPAVGYTGIATPPRTLFFNGTTDYAFVTAFQNSGGNLSLSTLSDSGVFYAVYQGATLPEEVSPPVFDLNDPDPDPDPPTNPVIQRFTKDYYPVWSDCWNAYGKRSEAGAYQGRYSSGTGYQYTKWGFNDAQIRSDLSGATIVSTHWQMRNQHSYYGSGITVMLGTHNNASQPSGSSSANGNPNIYRYHQNNGASLNKQIPNSFATALQNNTAKGIMIGSWNSGGLNEYGYFHRYGTYRPRLRIVYDKAV